MSLFGHIHDLPFESGLASWGLALAGDPVVDRVVRPYKSAALPGHTATHIPRGYLPSEQQILHCTFWGYTIAFSSEA